MWGVPQEVIPFLKLTQNIVHYQLATLDAFLNDPLKVWNWYLYRMWLIANAIPNPGHIAIVNFENFLKDRVVVITQNVDGLHREAGSKNFLELHGNIFEGKCKFCGAVFTEKEFANIFPYVDKEFLKGLSDVDFKEKILEGFTERDLPICPVCREILGPGVVWFGEALPEDVLSQAFSVSKGSDVFFSVGTSALVQPAAALPIVAKESGAVLVEVNPEETSLSKQCDFVFRGSAARVLPAIFKEVKNL
ncbi:Sir2 family NAD-dependent protein deacetylase [Desulfurobacterium indicum]|uniref:protein acetyllysine N-acetyltransferase n=1 Tax=Desulfurobacterium indicum TaxID=1914305 RepID=A0A1R1MJR9_9BACT|nr:Sir2 family NAD-dependent protein deacetylase [Desulfurobacterium indicum]OMH40051.1 NAD-dependent protein deacylase [Desulfurobacterium indicum]